MRGYAKTILDTVGDTPVVQLSRFGAGIRPNLFAKIESMNPAGSMKDRAAMQMIEKAERDHDLKPGARLVVATSGNMGIGMAMVCAVKQFQLICLIDPKISPATERCLKLYGAKLVKVLQPDETGGYHLTRLNYAKTLLAKYPDAVYLDQYDSAANMEAHYASTAPEMYRALYGNIRAVIVVAGTGGSSMGVARYFKEQSPKTDIWIVDEYGSVALPGNDGASVRFLNGMGTSIAPKNYEQANYERLVDHTVYVGAEKSIAAAVDLARTEGILTGGTGGAALHVMRDIVAEHYDYGDNLIALLADHGSRYTDTQYNEEWLTVRDLFVPAICGKRTLKK